MDIVRIKGENIASLAKPFDIRFDEGPLSGTGLFAITGETGAGKSSLLDALCLALYGDCPRLGSTGVQDQVPDISGDMIQSTDPRSMLRRGASAGYAAVEFRSKDGEIYEAHWSVRRARGKESGRLQAVERSITRLSDGKILHNQTRAVLGEVISLTGLTYDEFRRSVLLAQGDFDSFLSATTKERAAILEKVTNSSLYRDISKRAYAAFAKANKDVQEIETRLGEHESLSEEEEQAQNDLVKTLTEQSQEAQTQKKKLGDDLAIYKALDAARQQIEEAQKDCDALNVAWAEAQDDRALLANLQKAASLRGEWRAEKEATDAVTQATKQHEITTKAHQDALQDLDKAAKKAETANIARDQCEARFKELGPQWSQAEQLDAKVATASDELEQSQATHCDRQSALAEKASLLAEAKSDLEKHQTALTDLQKRRDAEPAAAIFAEKWDILQDRLASRIKLATDNKDADQQHKKLQQSLKQDVARKTEIDSLITASKQQINEAEQILAKEEPQRASLAEKDPTNRLLKLNLSLSNIRGMKGLARDHTEAEHAITQLTRHRDALIKETAEQETLHEKSTSAIAEAAIRIDTLQNSTALAEATISKEAARLRNQLSDGEPCPVCGSKDHPVHQSDLAQKLAKDLRAQLDAARRDSEQALEQGTKAKAAIDAAKIDQDATISKIESQKQSLTDHAKAYVQYLAAEKDGPIADSLPELTCKAASELETLAERMKGWQTQLTKDQEQLEISEGRCRQAQTVIQNHSQTITKLTGALDDIRRKVGPDELALQQQAQNLTETEQRLAALDEELTRDFAPLSNETERYWQRFDHMGQRHLDQLIQRKTQHHALLDQLEEHKAQEGSLEKAFEAASLVHANANTSETQANEAMKARQAQLAALQKQRAGLLDGQPTGAHRTAFNEQRKQAHDDADHTQKAHSDIKATVSGLEAQAKAEAKTIESTKQRHERAAQVLAEAFAQIDLSREEVTSLLEWKPEKLTELETRLTKLEQEKATAATRLETRKKDHQALQQKGLPELDRATIEAHIAMLEEADEQRQTERQEALVRLQMNKETRQKMATLLGQLDKTKARAEVWSAISDVIGAADGAKFSEIAQAVTLGILVEHANHHLADIKPRYRLAMGEGKLSLHVIDEHMAGEIRSTRSLSGGERFLISLSLALALSTIGGGGAIASMLFIDEGFGTLDAESLEMAINALEALQAQGRVIGVISHVQAMKDRIPVQIQVKPQGGGSSEIVLAVG